VGFVIICGYKKERRTTSINRGSSSKKKEVDEEIERCGY
jgi:hypothetical protein